MLKTKSCAKTIFFLLTQSKISIKITVQYFLSEKPQWKKTDLFISVHFLRVENDMRNTLKIKRG